MNQIFKEFDHKIISSFKVIGNTRVLVELQLPQLMKIHNVFYSNLLCKASTELMANESNELPPLIIINDQEK